MKETCILIIHPDPGIRRILRLALEAQEFIVSAQNDVEVAMAELCLIETPVPSLIILGTNDVCFCQSLREKTGAPLVVISAKRDEMTVVNFLNAGADDFVVIPFSLPELMARIKAILRRTFNDPTMLMTRKYVYDGLEVNLISNRVKLNGKEIKLTGVQFKMLSYLVVNAGRVLTYDQIVSHVWDKSYTGDCHVVHVNMTRLRQALGEDFRNPRYLELRSGIGYMMKNNFKEDEHG